MEEFDCSQLNDAVSPVFLNELASCQFISGRQNVVMIGNPGRDKTHLSIALGLKACTQGYNVLFKNAATLSTELCEAKDNYRLGKLERTLAKADPLMLDWHLQLLATFYAARPSSCFSIGGNTPRLRFTRLVL